jgi:hypothetical protein
MRSCAPFIALFAMSGRWVKIVAGRGWGHAERPEAVSESRDSALHHHQLFSPFTAAGVDGTVGIESHRTAFGRGNQLPEHLRYAERPAESQVVDHPCVMAGTSFLRNPAAQSTRQSWVCLSQLRRVVRESLLKTPHNILPEK